MKLEPDVCDVEGLTYRKQGAFVINNLGLVELSYHDHSNHPFG